jgi:hypothetical protein
VDHRGLSHRVEPGPQPDRQRAFQLGQRAQRRLLDAGDRAGRARPQREPDGDGLLVVQQQRRHSCTGSEPVAARGAGARPHLITELAQAVHVVANGARGDLQAAGQLRARPVPPGLEEPE